MQAWFRGALLSVLAFGGSWTGSIWYWRSTNRMPATGELAAYLLALPLALLMGYWLLRKGAETWSAREPAATGANAPSGVSAASATDTAARLPVAGLRIAAAALRAPHGESAAALAEAMASNKARPELDKDLHDDDGFPVMSLRADGVDEEAIAREVNQWLEDNGQAALNARAEFWRALALATPVVEELALSAAGHQRLAEAAALAGGHGNPGQASRAMNAIPMLQLAALLPPDWNGQWRDVAGRWLRQQLVLAGWPQDRVSVNTRPDQHPGPLLAALRDSAEPCIALLLACASHIGAATIDAWAGDNLLFTSSQPQGAMPGEGAAGLLLADEEQARLLGAGPYPLLAAVAAGSRRDDVDKARSGECALLKQLARQALKPLEQEASARAAQATPPDGQPAAAPDDVAPEPAVALIVADTGHRGARVMELMAASHALQPRLDPAKDILALGNATGQAGNAGFLAALALAWHETQERGEPVLCIANEDPYLRCAALIRPATPA
ncbi:hypothetical protein [Pseudoduganella namucuonensis]|uniref:3-oxoacyl-ACP synthase n=1 Tax=Pseudoduganella namucuonensis TaxID=1035707 RepID=A0A1I7JFE9_9BURK|nr:hypothetical protein [Pseudoduganella namucuonensis]SFU83879.1 hypothetical protein SAMN05216552_101185 [Pseudoduganella namucuonensis]